MLAYVSAYQVLRDEREAARAAHRALQRGCRTGPIRFTYPEQLHTLPRFADWLYEHVRQLRESNFPVPRDIVTFSCPPSEIAYTYNAMWAYGCHYRCDLERGPSHITYDSGIASMSSHTTNTVVDVGVLKSIISVQYAAENILLMKASWIPPTQEGQATIKKDGSGFWMVKWTARQDSQRHNPYVFPCTISQVFFMSDRLQADWRVVLRHEARSRRRVDETQYVVFGAGGAAEEEDLVAPAVHRQNPVMEGDEVDVAAVRAIDATTNQPQDDSHLADLQYEYEEDEE